MANTKTMKLYRVLTFLFTSIATGLAAAFIVLVLRPDLLPREALPERDKTTAAPPARIATRAVGPASYANAVQRTAPSVVNVFATKITRDAPHPLLNDPLFKHFFGDRLEKPTYRRENSLGSGVVVDGNGYILTNHHVIAGASEIQVVLADGRQLSARIVGTDPETDLAVLQASGGNLPVAVLGQSDTLQVGDVVLAIGNPFAVGQTVTLGIVSATGRDHLGITAFENFIQTDAAINPGNSGGALINSDGEVVGINTAIFSDSGGSHGIGFAIPINLAEEVLSAIIKDGKVVRGWLGITGQNITPELAESFGFRHAQGLLVASVLENGPADRAGLKPGDLITEIDGQHIRESRQLLDLVANKKPGSRLDLTVARENRILALRVIVTERPPNP